MTFSYPDYLHAKRTVDARARHPRLWRHFLNHLQWASHSEGNSVRVLEIGAGTGDLAARLIRRMGQSGGATPAIQYTIVDLEEDNLQAAQQQLQSILSDEKSNDGRIQFDFVHGNILDPETVTALQSTHYNGIIGQAVFDLLPTDEVLRVLASLSTHRTYIYLPIHFDGLTEFESVGDTRVDVDLDRRVMSLYHASMKRDPDVDLDATVHRSSHLRVSADGARSGRNLLTTAAASGFRIVDAAGSDWIVLPGASTSSTSENTHESQGIDSISIDNSVDGNTAERESQHSKDSQSKGSQSKGSQLKDSTREDAYPADEGYFLDCMIGFVESELADHPELSSAELQAWVSARRAEREEGRLMLVAHHLDILLEPESRHADAS